MVRMPDDWDPEAPGSRFTSRPGIAIAAGDSEYLTEHDVHDRFPWLLADDADLGTPRYSLGAYGRGAGGTIAIIEWVGLAAAQGIIGTSAVSGITAAARRMATALQRVRDVPDATLSTTRGMAGLVAVQAVEDVHGESERLGVEAVEQPSTMGGEFPLESNHVSIEPWIVLLVNESCTTRFVVAVAPDGEILGSAATRMGEFERMYRL